LTKPFAFHLCLSHVGVTFNLASNFTKIAIMNWQKITHSTNLAQRQVKTVCIYKAFGKVDARNTFNQR